MSRHASLFAGAALCVALAPSLALAQADAGIVTRQSGGAAQVRSGGAPVTVVPFMKLRAGDRLELPAGVALRVTYLKSGASEDWSGPAAFTAGEDGATNGTGKVATTPPARNVPDARELARIGNLATSRMGAVVVRSLRPPNPALDGARERYERWRAGAPAGDMLPHLYWLAAVRELSGDAAFRNELESLRRQYPEAPEFEALGDNARR